MYRYLNYSVRTYVHVIVYKFHGKDTNTYAHKIGHQIFVNNK